MQKPVAVLESSLQDDIAAAARIEVDCVFSQGQHSVRIGTRMLQKLPVQDAVLPVVAMMYRSVKHMTGLIDAVLLGKLFMPFVRASVGANQQETRFTFRMTCVENRLRVANGSRTSYLPTPRHRIAPGVTEARRRSEIQ